MNHAISIVTLMSLLMSFDLFADEPITPIINLFDAMREHDGEKLKAQFTSTALLQRALNDGTVRKSDIKKFADSILHSKSYLDEHLLATEVFVSDNLASIWTPYAFYLDGKLSHCGVNSFQTIQTSKGWKIQFLIDNSHQGNCEKFINQYQ